MYLLPAGQSPRTVNKWGLGALGWQRTQRRSHLRGLGQDSPDCPGSVIDPITGELCANFPPIAAPPSQPGVNPAVQAAYQNLLTQQQNSQNPLDYVSPQAAIAAGLPSQAVYNAWSAAMAKFPSQQAALNSGVPAGVVTQLWAQSRAAAPAATSFLDAAPLGVPNIYLIGGGLAFFLLPSLMGRGRR